MKPTKPSTPRVASAWSSRQGRQASARLDGLYLNTSNPHKLREFRRLGLSGIKALRRDLPEPDADPLTVIRSKASQVGPNVIVEDTSLDVDGADVGVNVKWLLDNLDRYQGRKATFRVLLGVLRGGRVEVYEGRVQGTLVPPRGDGFGFDPVFLPDGASRTLGEAKPDRYNARALAVSSFLRGSPSRTLAPLGKWEGAWQGTRTSSVHRHASASRVARRHVAGLFEPPPRVVKAIADWTLSVYAGHVLAYIQNKIDTKPDDIEKRLAQTQKYLQEGHLAKKMDRMRPGDLLRIPAGRNTDVAIKQPDLEDTDFGFSYQGSFQILTVKKGQRAKFPRIPDEESSKYDGEVVGHYKAERNWDNDIGEYLRSLDEPAEAENKVEAILRKGLETYSKAVRQNVRERMNPERLVELELMRREAKKFTSKAKAYRAKARTTLPIDLSGWKYLDGMSASEVEQKQVEGKFTAFTCVLDFIGHKKRGGQWDSRKQELQVDVSNTRPTTLKALRNEILWIRHVARHEGIHLGQTALQIVKDLGPWRAGYPSFDIHEEKGRSEYTGGKRLPHPRRSVEFYSRLPDEVEDFAVEIKSIPLPKRRGFMRKWFDTRPFFRENKKHNLSKWKKMVGEFVSEVEKQGIYIPASTSVSETATVSESATIGPDTHIEGSPYILGQAKVLGAATVKDSARVSDKAVVKGHAIVGGQGMVLGQATISGSAVVSGAYIISGDAEVWGSASIKGGSGRGVTIEGTVSGGVVKDNARVLGSVFGGVVEGRAIVDRGAAVKGEATVGGNAFIGGRAVVSRDAVVMGNTRIEGSARVSGGRWDGEHVTSGRWSEPPQTRELRKGDVVYYNPRKSFSSDDGPQWVIVGEVLGMGMRQEHKGVVRVPTRYALWKLHPSGKDLDFIGDWDDFDLDLDRNPSGTDSAALKQAWNRYSA